MSFSFLFFKIASNTLHNFCSLDKDFEMRLFPDWGCDHHASRMNRIIKHGADPTLWHRHNLDSFYIHLVSIIFEFFFRIVNKSC